MSCDYQILTNDNLVLKSYFGQITYRCVLDLLDRIEIDPDYREGMFELDDLRGVTDFAITGAEVRKFADLIKGVNTRRRKPTRKAVLSPHAQGQLATLTFAREVEDVPGLEVAVFTDPASALDFLDISNPYVHQMLAGRERGAG